MMVLAFLAQTLRIAIPYLFAAAGGIVAERAGVISLTLEGFMLSGAFTAVVGTFYTGNPWLGVLCGMLGGFTTYSSFNYETMLLGVGSKDVAARPATALVYVAATLVGCIACGIAGLWLARRLT